jgi:dihydrolipoamide dehydrogenase
VGDAAGAPLLAHKAGHEGRVAARVLAGRRAAFTPRAVPSVEYTDPEIAWCGLTEHEARARGVPVAVTRFPWAASGRAATLGWDDGLTKLIIDPATERVLGAGIVGTNAGELIAETALAVERGAPASDLAETIHPHPSLSETVMEAAQAFYGEAASIFRPQR